MLRLVPLAGLIVELEPQLLEWEENVLLTEPQQTPIQDIGKMGVRMASGRKYLAGSPLLCYHVGLYFSDSSASERDLVFISREQ